MAEAHSPTPSTAVSHGSAAGDADVVPSSPSKLPLATSHHREALEIFEPKHSFPVPFYFLSYATPTEYALYALGLVGATVAGLPFAALDLTYGLWTNGLLHGDTPRTPAQIRDASREAALIAMGAAIGSLIFSTIFWTCFTAASARICIRIRTAYLAAVLYQDAAFFDDVGPGEVANRMTRDVGLVKAGVGEKAGLFAMSFVTFLAGIIVAFVKAPRLAGVLISIIPFALILFGAAGFLGDKVSNRSSRVEGKASSFVEQVLSSIRIVHAFAAEKGLLRTYDNHLREIETAGFFKSLYKGFELSTMYFSLFTSYALAFWYGSRQIVEAGLSIGDLATAFFSVFNALFSVVAILPHISVLLESISAQSRIKAEIERPSAIDARDTSGVIAGSGEKTLPGADIELRDVSFSYPSRPHVRSLDGVSLLFPRGKVTAIVGASGSGKSTAASLLLRQYDLEPPSDKLSAGEIFFNGVPLRDLNVSWLRSQIAVIQQDPQLFNGTILENVAVGLTGTALEYRPDVDRPGSERAETVRQLCRDALEKAQALDFVLKLPQGLDTPVTGARTGVLSGGQRQRVAVARALVRRPAVLILDEGTSALDSKTEKRLQDAVNEEQAKYGMTVILIAHRLSTVRDADSIIVMENGRKLEEGSWDELIPRQGAFFQLVERQRRGIEEAAPDTSDAPEDEGKDAVPSLPEHTLSRRSSSRTAVVMSTPAIHPLRTTSCGSSTQSKFSSTIAAAEVADAPAAAPSDRESDAPARALLARFWRYLKAQWTWLLFGSLAAIVVGATFPVAGYMTGTTIESLSLPDPRQLRHEANLWALYYTIMAAGVLVLCLFHGLFLENGAERLTRRLRRDGLSAIIRQEIGFFEREDNGAGALTAAVANHPSQVAACLGLVLGQLLISACNLVGSTIMALVLSWRLAVVSLCPLVLFIPLAWGNTALLERFEHVSEQPVSRATSFATENVDAVKTVAAFGRERLVLESFQRRQQPEPNETRLLVSGSAAFGGSQAIVFFVCALIFYWGGELFARDLIDTTALYATFEATAIATFAGARIFTFIGDVSRAVHSFKAIAYWQDRRPLFASLPPSPSSSKEAEDIIFDSVTLRYPTRLQRPALSDFSLQVKEGQTIAFCGPSGSGKSSVLALLMRFYETAAGSISIGGQDIRSVSLEEHRARIGLVSQDPVLYEGTVRYNLELGAVGTVTQQELEEACEQAAILDFIQGLPQGFDTQIGIKGSQMSGGQRQRLCIARALLRKPQILLLDEATSALDIEAEVLVQAALDRAAVGRTTITIAHRLSTIRGADVICVVDGGRIVETGSHAELLARRGRYFELVEMQL